MDVLFGMLCNSENSCYIKIIGGLADMRDDTFLEYEQMAQSDDEERAYIGQRVLAGRREGKNAAKIPGIVSPE